MKELYEDYYLNGLGTTAPVQFIFEDGEIKLRDMNTIEEHREYVTYLFRFLVDRKKCTHEQIAKEINLSKEAVSRWYRTNKKGNSKIPSCYFMDLAKFFDICPTWFYSIYLYLYFDIPKDGEKYKLNAKNKHRFLTHLGKWEYTDIELAIQKRRFIEKTMGDLYIEYAQCQGYTINTEHILKYYDILEYYGLEKKTKISEEDKNKHASGFIKADFIKKSKRILKEHLTRNTIRPIHGVGVEPLFLKRNTNEEKRKLEFCLYNSQCDIEDYQMKLEEFEKMIALGLVEEKEIDEKLSTTKRGLEIMNERKSKYESMLQEFSNITNE